MKPQPKDAPIGGLLIGIDTGGTFTDVVMLDTSSGRMWVAKTASTPEDPSRSFGQALADGLSVAGAPADQVERVLHGTTVATNLILERKGPRVAMIVTSGFRYVVEIGRHNMAKRANPFVWVKPKRPAQPDDIWEVPGRMDPSGRIVQDLDEDAVRAAAREIVQQGVRTVAVVLLNSYANADHERRVGEILRAEHPGLQVSLSCEVLPVIREYERSITTLLNAYVTPAMSSYVDRLEQRTLDQGIHAPLLVMKSSGGVSSTRNARVRAVETVLSGPAAGAVGASFVGAASGFSDLICIDIGGTSADIGLIQGGSPHLTTSGTVGDWSVGLPMIDILTIGAGGGSIARVTSAGGLQVGPESAGARPGPVCYRRGGTEPTVTDAHLVLGHLTPYLLAGRFGLDVDGARDAIARHIAAPLGLNLVAAARGILEVVDNNMVGAIRVVSVDRGLDPRDFVLVPFGGAGPLHGGTLARMIGCKTILIPPAPGVLAALGLLVSNLRAEFARTCLQLAGRYDVHRIAEVFDELTADALRWLDAEQVAPASRRLLMRLDLRYKDQSSELELAWAGAGRFDEAALVQTIAAFHARHERLYGFRSNDIPVELVTLRVDAIGMLPAVAMPELAAGNSASAAITGEQRVAFRDGPAQVPVYDRTRLGAGVRIEGPAIVTQLDSTSLILPGQWVEVDRCGSLIVREESGS
jgi:N-methylhydantoinase A